MEETANMNAANMIAVEVLARLLTKNKPMGTACLGTAEVRKKALEDLQKEYTPVQHLAATLIKEATATDAPRVCLILNALDQQVYTEYGDALNPLDTYKYDVSEAGDKISVVLVHSLRRGYSAKNIAYSSGTFYTCTGVPLEKDIKSIMRHRSLAEAISYALAQQKVATRPADSLTIRRAALEKLKQSVEEIFWFANDLINASTADSAEGICNILTELNKDIWTEYGDAFNLLELPKPCKDDQIQTAPLMDLRKQYFTNGILYNAQAHKFMPFVGNLGCLANHEQRMLLDNYKYLQDMYDNGEFHNADEGDEDNED